MFAKAMHRTKNHEKCNPWVVKGFTKKWVVLPNGVCPLLVVLNIDDSGLELAG